MIAIQGFRRSSWFVMTLLLLAVQLAGAPSASQEASQDEELRIGQEVFEQLRTKGEIIESSPEAGVPSRLYP